MVPMLLGADAAAVHEFEQEVRNGELYDRVVPTGMKMLAQMRVKNPMESVKTVAKAIGVSYQTAKIWMKRPDYQRYESWLMKHSLPELPEETRIARETIAERVREKFESHAEDMQDRLLEILETVDDPRLQAEIAKDWLDRTGHGARREEKKGSSVMVLSGEAMAEILRRAEEAGLRERPVQGVVVGNSPA